MVTEFMRTDFGGEWIDSETGDTTCEVTLERDGDGHIISVDVWRPETGTVTYRDIRVLPVRGIPEFGVENDLAVLVDTPGYDLPVAVTFGIAKSSGTREPDDNDEMFFRTLVEALEGGYEEAIRKHQEKVVAYRGE